MVDPLDPLAILAAGASVLKGKKEMGALGRMCARPRTPISLFGDMTFHVWSVTLSEFIMNFEFH